MVQNQHDAVGVTPIDGDDHRDVRDVHRDAYHRRCACCDRPEIDIFLKNSNFKELTIILNF